MILGAIRKGLPAPKAARALKFAEIWHALKGDFAGAFFGGGRSKTKSNRAFSKFLVQNVNGFGQHFILRTVEEIALMVTGLNKVSQRYANTKWFLSGRIFPDLKKDATEEQIILRFGEGSVVRPVTFIAHPFDVDDKAATIEVFLAQAARCFDQKLLQNKLRLFRITLLRRQDMFVTKAAFLSGRGG